MADTTLPGLLRKGVAASRPAANAVAVGTIYSATDTGAITQSDGSTWSAYATISTASMATDTLWDAAGDLAVGTGANTAGRLAIGAAGGALSRINGAVAWNSGTSNPGAAAAGDRFWRTDLGLEIYYDGTRWLSTTLYRHEWQKIPNTAITTNQDLGGRAPSWAGDFDEYILTFGCQGQISTTNDGTKFWTVDLYRQNTGTVVATVNTSTWTAGTFTRQTVAVNALLGNTAGNYHVEVFLTKTSTPGEFICAAWTTYRLVVP